MADDAMIGDLDIAEHSWNISPMIESATQKGDSWRDGVEGYGRRDDSRHAVFLFGRRVTPWRRSQDSAIEDALAQGLATIDAPYRAPYFWVGADIVSRRVG